MGSAHDKSPFHAKLGLGGKLFGNGSGMAFAELDEGEAAPTSVPTKAKEAPPQGKQQPPPVRAHNSSRCARGTAG